MTAPSSTHRPGDGNYETLIKKYVQEKYSPEILDAAEAIRQKNILSKDLRDDVERELNTDGSWIGHAFMVGDVDSPSEFFDNYRYLSTADCKFTDSTFGGNLVINPRQQFTRYADPRKKGILQGRRKVTVGETNPSLGMGSYYSEAIDDNKQSIQMTFGVPQFNSITGFLSRAINPNLAMLANTGKAKSIFYKTIRNIGAGVRILAFLGAFPIATCAYYAAKPFASLFGNAGSRYYSMKPEMHLYWAAVNALVLHMAINSGIISKGDNSAESNEQRDIGGVAGGIGDQEQGGSRSVALAEMEALHELAPYLFNKEHGLDMYVVANRAQSLYNHSAERNNQLREMMSPEDAATQASTTVINPDEYRNPGLIARLQTWLSAPTYDADASPPDSTTSEAPEEVMDDPSSNNKTVEAFTKSGSSAMEKLNKVQWNDPKYDVKVGGKDSHYKDYEAYKSDGSSDHDSIMDKLVAEYQDGSQFISFHVDSTTSVSETISNSVGDSELAGKFNQMSNTGRNMKFSFAGGNVGDGMIANAAEGAFKVASSVVGELADGLTAGMSSTITNALFGGGYIDIPKQWENSTIEINKTSYTISLVSADGHPVSRLQNIFVPLCCLLAGTLPLSTGRQGYTSPFLVQVFDRGRQQVKMGIISNLTITRGTTNLPFTNSGAPLGIDVSFSIADLSSVMHMPISSGVAFSMPNINLDEDNMLYDYLATLTGMSLRDQYYTSNKFHRKVSILKATWRSYFSKSRFASKLADFTTNDLMLGRAVSAFSDDTVH